MARARCVVAEAEIALVSRDLGRSSQMLKAARVTLAASGDRTNASHAGYLEARRLLLIGRLDEAEAVLATALPARLKFNARNIDRTSAGRRCDEATPARPPSAPRREARPRQADRASPTVH